MLKKNDFIELDYTGYTSNDVVFDTTKQDVAKKHDLKEGNYKPLVIAVGRRHILPGLDQKLIGLTIGKHEINLSENEAFGPKDPKNLKLMPMKLFKKENIRPFVGLELNIDDRLGVVRNVSGGRVIVDFNHPLAGQSIKYEVEIKSKVEDKQKQVEGVLKILNIPFKSVSLKEKEAKVITLMKLPEPVTDMLNKELNELTGLKVIFEEEKKEEKKTEDKKV